MKRIASIAALMLISITSFAQAKMDLSTAIIVDDLANGSQTYKSQAMGESHEIGLMVTMRPGVTAADLEAAGATVTSMMGRVATVSIAPENIVRLSEVEGVEFLSRGNKLTPTLYNARIATNANAALDGTEGFSHAFTGAGVVTGLVDIGIDPNHINFLNPEGTETRVKRVYEFNSDDGTCIGYETPEAIAAYTTDSRYESHGTHTAGIMAGSYRGEGTFGLNGEVITGPNPYYGLASESEIVMNTGELFDANICAGVGKVIEYAESIGRPAVINLSLGSMLGPHDGTDPTSLYLAEAGKHAVICLASGNDGDSRACIHKTFAENDTVIQAFLGPKTTGSFRVEFWGSTDEPFGFEFVIYDQSKKEIVASVPLTATDKVVRFSPSTEGVGEYLQEGFSKYADGEMIAHIYPTDNRYYVEASFNLSRPTPPNYNLLGGVRITGKPGYTIRGNSWAAYFGSVIHQGWTVGDGYGSISAMATGDNVIAVGAYTSTQPVTRLTGEVYTDQYLLPDSIYKYTSYGPGKDGRPLPDFIAPGANINSSLNHYWKTVDEDNVTGKVTYNGTDYLWGSMQGTSMATPFVAGTCALMLEADPSLTVNDIREILSRTARMPDREMTPNERMQWGAGLIDTSAALHKVMMTTQTGRVFNDPDKSVMVSRSATGIEVFAAGASEITAEIYDMAGRRIATSQSTGNTVSIDRGTAMSGVYVVKVTTPTSVVTRKAVL